jgi:hypothetical protein
MAWVLSLLLCLAPVAAANNDDDGFIWVDANTKIKLKPIGAAGSGSTKAPEEPRKPKKPGKPKK